MDAQRDTFIEGCIVPHVSVTIEDGSILRIASNRMLKRADGGEPVTAREAFEAKAEVIISIKPAKIVSIKEHKSLGINRARAGEFFDLIDKFAGYGFSDQTGQFKPSERSEEHTSELQSLMRI